MNVEYIFSRLSLKSSVITDNVGGGTPLLTAEEQLTILAVCKNKNKVGFAALMVEFAEDKDLHPYINGKILEEFGSFRSLFNDDVCSSLASLLIHEIKNPHGVICSECGGSGEQKTKHRQAFKCRACNKGRVKWDDESRYAFFASISPTSFSRFKDFLKYYNRVREEILTERDKARAIIENQLERELAA